MLSITSSPNIGYPVHVRLTKPDVYACEMRMRYSDCPDTQGNGSPPDDIASGKVPLDATRKKAPMPNAGKVDPD